ncbi:MAG: TIGR04255 family protein [Casimicrobium sp.]
MKQYPIKLGKEPLIEAVFELRFSSSVDASLLLPGLFYSSLGATGGERLGMDLPAEVEKLDPNLAFQPKLRLGWNGFTLLVAKHSVALTCPQPYPGWSAFRPAITQLLKVIASASQITSINRFSMRYIDMLSGGSLREEIAKLNLTLVLAGKSASSRGFGLRLETEDGDITHTIQIAAPAGATIPNLGSRVGVVVDVDSSIALQNINLVDWIGNSVASLDRLHSSNKGVFFDCLTESGLASLEPVYAN